MNELYHHGIKGQRWGVRNGPPYPIENKTMPKGTVLRSVSSKYISGQAYKDAGRPIYTYNPNDKWDSTIYRGPFSMYLFKYRGARFIADHEFETAKDLKMPTKKERMDEFKNLYNDRRYKRKMISEMSRYQDALSSNAIGSKESHTVNLRKLKTDSDFKAAYEVFNHAMEATHNNKSTQEYMRRMSKKYDAMVDDNNQGIYNEAHDPVIIFKTKDLIERNNGVPVSYLTYSEISNNTQKMREELAKKGKNVLL